MEPTLSNDIAYILPLLGAIFVHYLKSRNMASWKNALIAGIFLVAIAIACAWLGNGFIPGNVRGSILAVIGYVVLLMNGALKMIMQYFEEMDSPLAPDPPYVAPQFRRSVTTSAVDVPPRASGKPE